CCFLPRLQPAVILYGYHTLFGWADPAACAMMQSLFGTAPHFSDRRRHIMATVVGSGMLLFTPVENWEKLPSGWEFIDVAGVAVDSKDNVYVFNRSEHPVMVFDRDGNFMRSWGEGMFSTRTPGSPYDHDDL